MHDINTSTQLNIGGKAQRLIELQLAGFRVPEFICSQDDIESALQLLGTPVAVRSSASAEDGAEISFAGQFESTLGLQTACEVKKAIARCEASVRDESVIAYCRKNGVDPAALQMCVIVQRMIEPELAGVAFTIDPMTGREDVVIEACEGRSDDLLQGSAQPLPNDHPLLLRYAPDIERVAREVQRHFGEPQDIEFAIQDGELYLLQARPITRIHFAAEVGEWTNADFRDGGVSSGVCTPLMWSLYDYIWQDALTGFLRDIKLLSNDENFEAARLFFGRPYWNLGAVKKCMTALPGFNERQFDEDLHVRADYEGDGAVTPVAIQGILRALPTVLAVPKIWKYQQRFDEDFLNGGFDRLVAEVDEFRDLIEHAFRITETNYFRTIFCASLAKLDFAEAFPDATDTALFAGLPPIRHLEPMRAIAAGERDVSALMRRFRHHSRNELDLRAPRWDEDREWVEATVENASESSQNPQVLYEAALARELQQLPAQKRRSFRKKLGRLRHFLWLREEMRDLSTQMYYYIRRHVLEIAENRGLGDDIFFMTWREILSRDTSGIEPGRAVFDSYRNFDAPNEIGVRFAHMKVALNKDSMRGVGASPGSVSGPAYVARNVDEAMDAPTGSILVCPFTDPGWTPVLGRVAAVVTENGGLLSHAAVICREYGIPAVLGVNAATRTITNGTQLLIDGATGSVSIETP